MRRAIYRALSAFAASRSLPIAFPNADPPDTSAPHLRVSTLPVPPDVRGVNSGEARYVWLVQVSCFVRDGGGEITALAHLDALREAYPYAYEFAGDERRFQVTAPLAIAPPVALPGWLSIPGTLRVQCFD